MTPRDPMQGTCGLDCSDFLLEAGRMRRGPPGPLTSQWSQPSMMPRKSPHWALPTLTSPSLPCILPCSASPLPSYWPPDVLYAAALSRISFGSHSGCSTEISLTRAAMEK